MSGHSPEPWRFDAESGCLYDAHDNLIGSTVWPGRHDVSADANGHRIAALSAENARLREALEAFLKWDSEPFGAESRWPSDILAMMRAALSRPEAGT